MVICFDLDGTILDTYNLIRETFIQVFKKYYPKFQPTEEDLRTYFGPSLVETFTKVGCSPDEVVMMYDNYRRINKELQPKLLKIYPGCIELLERLKGKGYKLAILSNKINSVIVSGLEEVNARGYFDLIVGYDDVGKPKPSREGLDQIRKYFNDDVLYVGDSPGDMQTAKNSDAIAIGVSQAVITEEELFASGADYVISKIGDLDKLLEELNVWYFNNR